MNGPYLLNINFPPHKDGLCQVCLNYPSGSWEEDEKCEKFKDRRTDIGRQTIRKAHLSFQLRWAVNQIMRKQTKQTNKTW